MSTTRSKTKNQTDIREASIATSTPADQSVSSSVQPVVTRSRSALVEDGITGKKRRPSITDILIAERKESRRKRAKTSKSADTQTSRKRLETTATQHNSSQTQSLTFPASPTVMAKTHKLDLAAEYQLFVFSQKLAKVPNRRSLSAFGFTRNYDTQHYDTDSQDDDAPKLDIDLSPALSPQVSLALLSPASSGHSSGAEDSQLSLDSSLSSSSSSSSLDYRPSDHLALPSPLPRRTHSYRFNFSLVKPVEEELFPELPVLNRIFERLHGEKKEFLPDLSQVVFACGQHMLNTTGSLFKMLIKLGAHPDNIFVIGKSYSNCKEVLDGLVDIGLSKDHVYEGSPRDSWGDFATSYDQDVVLMWRDIEDHIKKLKARNAFDSIIVLDDGGHVLKQMNGRIKALSRFNVGIEQTSSGGVAAISRSYPVIQVCSSAIKNWCEPPMVSAVVGQKVLTKILELNAAKQDFIANYGVVGCGNIGKSVLKELLGLTYNSIYLYDDSALVRESLKQLYASTPNIIVVEDVNSLFTAADIIIGCTGKDITAGRLKHFDFLMTDKMLVSCSSKDTEFNSLLLDQQIKNPAPKNPLKDVQFTNAMKRTITIVKGGLPVNFDNTCHSVHPNDIQLIRGLKLAAVLQAARIINDWKAAPADTSIIQNYQVDAEWQCWIFNTWTNTNPTREEYWKPYVSLVNEGNQIIQQSKGKPYVYKTSGIMDNTDDVSLTSTPRTLRK